MNSEQATSYIEWSSHIWKVKNENISGPGPNIWSNSNLNVWIDTEGNLHLKIIKNMNNWICSEIISLQSFGYGEYTFKVSSNIELLDKNIVLGLFTYENDKKEIDLEFTRKGIASNPAGWYVVQPSTRRSEFNFPLNLTGDFTTHKFIWSSSEILFQSYHGHSTEHLMSKWNYIGRFIPSAHNEKVHLNLWLNKGYTPSHQQESEVIIKSFNFTKIELNG